MIGGWVRIHQSLVKRLGDLLMLAKQQNWQQGLFYQFRPYKSEKRYISSMLESQTISQSSDI